MKGKRPVLFGEVLYDRFPDGNAVLGGAPFNVAWHAQAFGIEPLFVSRVGDDEAGHRVLAAMDAWGMDTSGMEIDRERPTGAVEVTLEDGEPSYDILADQAYDHIDAAALGEVPPEALLCHGTLALRGRVSRAAWERLARAPRRPRLVDVNLRAPWWTRADVLSIVRGAEAIKLNAGELALLADADAASPETAAGEAPGATPLDAAQPSARRLLEATGAEELVVTCGADGTIAFARDREPVIARPSGEVRVVDTVGAGDALTAVLILGSCLDWEPETTLQRGVDFAEAIVSQRGATTRDPDFYAPHLRRWSLA